MYVNTRQRVIFAPTLRLEDDGARTVAPILPTLPRLAAVIGEEERRERLAYWIRDIRFRRGLTPPKLADLVGVTRSTVNKWESGEQVPSMIWLGPLAIALRVDPRLFADLPAIPPNAAEQYLVTDALADAVGSGLEEGERRARTPGREDPGTPQSSPLRRARGA